MGYLYCALFGALVGYILSLHKRIVVLEEAILSLDSLNRTHPEVLHNMDLSQLKNK